MARSYASDLVVGVDVGPYLSRDERCESALHVLLRMDEIGERLLRRYSLLRADILVQPNVGHCPWFNFGNAEQMIQSGYDAGRCAIHRWRRTQPPERHHMAGSSGHRTFAFSGETADFDSLGCSDGESQRAKRNPRTS